jgi:histidinol-phosphatase
VFEDEVAFANELADEAARIGLSFFRTSFDVRLKADQTPVTEADIEIEDVIRRAVRERYPNDGVLGEEGGDTPGASIAPPEGQGGSRRWIVDPIDGTKNFADGVQLWSNLIALAVDDVPVVGVVNLPALGERYVAARGAGATLNGEPIHVSRADRVPRSFVVIGGMADWVAGKYAAGVQELVAESRRNRGFGDAWGHMLVARGAADVMLERSLATWDWAAVQVVVEEAGGRMSTFEGEPLAHGGTVLTTNGILHDEIVARLRSTRTSTPATQAGAPADAEG